jgi:diamine N-acetyltransferase
MLKEKMIVLRAVELTDKSIIYNWENDSEQWPISFTSKPFSSETIEQYISNDAYDIYTTKQLRLMICLLDQTIVGCIDLYEFDPRNQRAGVGILIDKGHRRKGYALEALNGLKIYAFETLFLNQLFAYIDDHNYRSISLFEKSNFKSASVLKNWNKKNSQTFNDVVVMQCFK